MRKTTVLAWFYFLSSLALPLAGAPVAQAAQKPPVRDWTLLVYLNGNNSLDSYGAMNLKQMEKIGSTSKVAIAVQWGSMDRGTSVRMLVQKSTDANNVTSPVLQDLGKVDLGDWHSLVDFVQWGVQNYPAKHYFIDVWNHGSGWHLKSLAQAMALAPGADSIFHPSNISWDDNTGNSFTTVQLGQAMAEAAKIIGHKVDLYASDACLMAMAEVATEMKDSVQFFAGSQELEPGAGWPYDAILTRWNAQSHASARDVAKILTEEYTKSYEGGENGKSEVTFSAYDLKQIGSLEKAVENLAHELNGLNAAEKQATIKVIGDAQHFDVTDYVDLGDFVHRLQHAKIGTTAVSQVKRAMNRFVISNHDTKTYAASTGVSLWIPSDSSTYSMYSSKYQQLAFDHATHWSDTLHSLLGDPSL